MVVSSQIRAAGPDLSVFVCEHFDGDGDELERNFS
jgi:hypothetical protein